MFVIENSADLPVTEVWRRLTHWERHATAVPLTRIVVLTPPPTGPGSRFTARTGWRRLSFDDPMEVVRWEPPAPGRDSGYCRLEKRGRVVLGWAEIRVRAEAPAPPGGRSRVEWREEVRLRGLPRRLDPLLRRAGRLLFGRTVRRLLRTA